MNDCAQELSLAAKCEELVADSAKDNLKSNEIVTDGGPSSTCSSLKSVKKTVVSKVNSFRSHKLPSKIESESHDSLTKEANQQAILITTAQSKSSLSKVPSKSISCATIPPENSKIPKRSPSSNIVAPTKLKEIGKSPPKIWLPKLQTEKQKKIGKFNINVAIYPNKKQKEGYSSFTRPASISSAYKCQSVCSSPKGANKRSVSNISTRSTPCNLKKNGCENAGDQKETENIVKKSSSEKQQNKENKSKCWTSSQTADAFKCQIERILNKWFLRFKSELLETSETKAIDNEKLENLQALQTAGILDIIDNWCKSVNESSENMADTFKKEIEDAKKSFVQFKSKCEEEKIKIEKDLAEKTELELNKKQELFQNKLKIKEKEVTLLKSSTRNLEKNKENLEMEKNNLQDELKKQKDGLSTTNKKLHEAEQNLKQQKIDLSSKTELIKQLENEVTNKKQLEEDLVQTNNKLQELQIKLEKQTYNECVEHIKEISELRNQINCLQTDKEAIQKRNNSLEQEIKDLHLIKDKLMETENKLIDLQTALSNKEQQIQESIPDCSKQLQKELNQFRQTNSDQRLEIDKLKAELAKAKLNNCQLEQQIERSQQLLEVRSGLINSLQTNEKTQRIHKEDLFSQLGEKNNTINELNSELQIKSEEFRNLCATLSAKQMELSNQQHIVKLFEESNQRNQMLRAKQEEKIGRVEEELARLKHIISIYQANVLAGTTNRHLLCPPPALPSSDADYNENFYYYASQRKQKRQIDINVKKFEI